MAAVGRYAPNPRHTDGLIDALEADVAKLSNPRFDWSYNGQRLDDR